MRTLISHEAEAAFMVAVRADMGVVIAANSYQGKEHLEEQTYERDNTDRIEDLATRD